MPVMVSLPPMPLNSLKVPFEPALVLPLPKPVASNVSALFDPRTDSTESNVSVPTVAASPVTIPAARFTLMPPTAAVSRA